MSVTSTNITQIAGQTVSTSAIDGGGVPKSSLSRYGVTIYNHASAAENGPEGMTTGLFVQNFSELLLLVKVNGLSGVLPRVTFFIDTADQQGEFYPIFESKTIDRENQKFAISIGAGCEVGVAFGTQIRFRWDISDESNGADVPTATFQTTLIGK